MRLWLTFGVLLFALPSAAQDVLRLTGVVVSEKEDDRTLISTPGWLRGLHILGQQPVPEPPVITAALPGDWEALCAKVTSIGGTYSITVRFDAAPARPEPQIAELAFDPGSKIPLQATFENSGVVLERGTCRSDQAESRAARQYTANFWNVTSEPMLDAAGNVTVLLSMNVARADQIRAAASLHNTALPVRCTKLDDPQALAFNFRCAISVPEALYTAPGQGFVSFAFERIHRGRVAPALSAEIFLGAGK